MLKNIITLLVTLIVFYTAQSKLYQVVSQFRHGARYHLNDYYDGNSTRDLWGELTAVGMRQHQTLGSLLREDYIVNLGFLSYQYKEGEIEIYTTIFNRTFESARSQLYGLYPLGFGQKMPEVDKQEYHLPPFSNFTDSSQQIFSLPEGHRTFPISINEGIDLSVCPNMDKEQQKNINYQLEAFREMNLTYYPFMKKVANVFNVPRDKVNFWTMDSIYDTLTVDKYLGRPLPKDFTEDDYVNIRHIHLWFNFLKKTHNLSKAINTGKIIKILQDFDDRIANLNNKTLKWTFISSHDADETAILQDLNFSSYKCIEDMYRKGETSALNCSPDQQYASNLIFQLHSDDGKQFYVKIRHDGKYLYLCERKQFSCSYEEWRDRVKGLIVDVETICQGPGSEIVSNQLFSLRGKE